MDVNNENLGEVSGGSCTVENGIKTDRSQAVRHGRGLGASGTQSMPTHAYAELARHTYLDYIHTNETKGQDNIKKKDYQHKVLVSGDVIEVYSYKNVKQKVIEEHEKEVEAKEKKEPLQKEEQEMEIEYIRKLSTIYRTKTTLKRLINANVGQYPEKDKFITLTFADYLDREEVLNRFKLFNKRFRYSHPDYDYQYVAVPERGTTGTKRLHLHCFFFGLPYIPIEDFKDLWQYGNVDIKAIGDYNEVANYVLKYIEKTMEKDPMAKGQKFYISSKGLKKPDKLFLNNKELDELLANHEDKEVVYEFDYLDKQNLERVEYHKIRKPHVKDIGWVKRHLTPEQFAEYEERMEERKEEQAEMDELLML